MKKQNLIYLVLFVVFINAIFQACKTQYFRSNYSASNELVHNTANLKTKLFLKAHLKNGEVCLFKDSWKVDTNTNILSGFAEWYDINRKIKDMGAISLNIDSVALFETNDKLVKKEEGRIAALAILTGINAGFTAVCLTNPKACFGSCPTFYQNENDNFHYADAEGFSNAIAPSMEYFDIDALNNKQIGNQNFTLTMKNEALETHCINELKLLAYPVNEGEMVFQSRQNEFYHCENNYQASIASATEGNIKTLIQSEDMIERLSYADGKNLSSKEEILLEFDVDNSNAQLGLIMSYRQSLMTTYFIYNAIAYMGDEVGDIFARLELNKELGNKLKGGIKKELGDIDIYQMNDRSGVWELQGGLYETGPIAINKQLIPLNNKASRGKVKIKVVMNKGLWRIDYLALTQIKGKVKPLEIQVNEVRNKGKLDFEAKHNLLQSNKYLISMPGSEYQLKFKLPASGKKYEVFLYSKGYYLEWMRENWLKDKNLLKLRQMIEQPKTYLKAQAQEYKNYEQSMEQEFWNSKIDTKNFSYCEIPVADSDKEE